MKSIARNTKVKALEAYLDYRLAANAVTTAKRELARFRDSDIAAHSLGLPERIKHARLGGAK